MYFHQLEAFIQIAENKSFSKAAKAMYLSQPTVSAHIKSLESELGVPLILRTTKEVLLSEAGQIFYDYAKELLHTRDVATLMMQSYATEIKGELPVAASTVPSQYLLPQLLTEMYVRYPDLKISVRQADSSAVINQIENYDAELGFTGMQNPDSKCIFEPLLDDQLVLITPNTPAYQIYKENFPVSQLHYLPFIFREKGSGTRKEADAFFQSIGLDDQKLHILTELPSTESIKQAVCHGLGVSIISKIAAKDYEKFGYLLSFDLDSELLKRSIYLVYHKNRVLTPAARSFVEVIREKYGPKPEHPRISPKVHIPVG